MKDLPIKELLNQIGEALEAIETAERARVQAEHKKSKARYNYLNLMDRLRAKEYTIFTNN